MAKITIQMGHCFRTKGATGTKREQEFASKVGSFLKSELTRLGHAVMLIGADESVPSGDVFIALHCDGSSDPSRRGASVGYPSDSDGKLARAWKAAHQLQGYPGGFLPDNYTAALRGYYGFGRAKGYKHEFLAEHGTTTNSRDESWLFGNLDKCVRAHVDAIGAIVGHPNPELKPPTQEDDMAVRALQIEGENALYAFLSGPDKPLHITDPVEFNLFAAGGLIRNEPQHVFPKGSPEAIRLKQKAG